MVRVYRRLKAEGLRARLILQVHDELIVECPAEEKERAAKVLGEEMRGAAELRVPLSADVNSGTTWYAAKGWRPPRVRTPGPGGPGNERQ